ncbi:zinc-binding dehydrogenase [Pseudonocardia sp. WMMC193]|uniref:zinc-binding dehydrogenase n=1 Tax=Pseudonocardia sp. WMMC193 TaxID=2911965 RepID=UPI0035ABF043
MGCHAATRAEIDEVLPLLADGTFRPVVDSVHPLEDVARALGRFQSPDRFGKVVLSIGRTGRTGRPSRTLSPQCGKLAVTPASGRGQTWRPSRRRPR